MVDYSARSGSYETCRHGGATVPTRYGHLNLDTIFSLSVAADLQIMLTGANSDLEVLRLTTNKLDSPAVSPCHDSPIYCIDKSGVF